jgi:hypothetical protein
MRSSSQEAAIRSRTKFILKNPSNFSEDDIKWLAGVPRDIATESGDMDTVVAIDTLVASV